MIRPPLPIHTLLRQLCERVGYLGELMHITPIVVGKSKEGSDVLYVLGQIPFLHSFDLYFNGTHSSWCHLVPKELDALVGDLALRCLHK